MRLGVVFIARGLALLWAAFWLFFFVAESWFYRAPARVMLLWTCAGVVFVVLALLPRRWEAAGGILLLAVGLLGGAAYAVWPPPELSWAGRVITLATLCVPPIVAGILFVWHSRAS